MPNINCICSNNIIINSKYTPHQVYDIDNNNSLFLTEYRVYKGYCKLCKINYQGELPKELDNPIIGHALKASKKLFCGNICDADKYMALNLTDKNQYLVIY